MITEQLMGLGRWSLRLRDATPRWITDYLDLARYAFSQIVITEAPVEMAGASAATLRSVARYTGVLRERRGLELGGLHVGALLGDEEGKGPLMEPGTDTVLFEGLDGMYSLGGDNGGHIDVLYDDNLSTVLALTLTAARSNGFTDGTVDDTGLGLVKGNYSYLCRRDAVALMCKSVGAEFRINPDLTVDAAVNTTLFSSSTVGTVITRRSEIAGRRSGDLLLAAGNLEVEMSADDYTTKAWVFAQGDGGTEVDSASLTTPFYGPGGALLKMERVIQGSNVDRGNSGTVADQQLGRFNAVKRRVRLSSSEYLLPADCYPGRWVYAYDPDNDVLDITNPVEVGGGVIFPLELRVYELTWPVRQGMGVYLVPSDTATPTPIDLTPWIVWEEGDTTVEVGTTTLPLSGAGASGGGGGNGFAAPSGVSPQTAGVEAWLPFKITSVVQNVSVTHTVLHAYWTRIGRTVIGRCLINFSSAGTAANDIAVNVSGLPAAVALLQGIGGGRYAGSTYIEVSPYINAAGTQFKFEPHGGTVPLALGQAVTIASGHNLYFTFIYEAAAP